MKKQMLGRILSALVCLSCALCLGGCAAQIEERAIEDLAQAAWQAVPQAPQQDTAAAEEVDVVLYFLDEEGMELVPVSRRISMEPGVSRAMAALLALCEGPAEGERAYWPQTGTLNASRGFELSGGVATVNLPSRLRALSPEELFAVRMAIAHTLTEFSEVSYVNVLVGGREEGFDLAATMPVGALSRMEDLEVSSRYLRLDEQRQSVQDAGVSRLTTLYFPSEDGRWILPEVRSVRYAAMEPIEYLYTILEELGNGTDNPLGMDVPEPMKYIEEMPEIVRTEDGAYRAIEIRLSAAIDDALRDEGLTRGIYLAMLTDTLMGFVPGMDGVQVFIGGEKVTGLGAEDTPDGNEIVFAQPLAVRDDFAGYVGAPGVVYLPARDHEKLEAVDCVFPQEKQLDARQRLWQLTQQLEMIGAIGDGLQMSDILAIGTDARCISLNLSERYAQALAGLTAAQERAAVYAIVNTLTEGGGAERVRFYFEGEQRAQLAGGLEMRGEFLRNPGMVVE